MFELTGIGVAFFHRPRLFTAASLSVSLVRLMVSVVTGGCVASYLSKRHLLLNPAIFGGLMLLLALFDGLRPDDIQPIWYSMFTLALLVPAAMTGGRVGRALKGG